MSEHSPEVTTPAEYLPADAERAVGERELGLVTPGAKTLKYAMVALEREGDGAGVMKLFRRAKQPDRDVYLIAARYESRLARLQAHMTPGCRSCLSQGMDKEAKVLEQRAQVGPAIDSRNDCALLGARCVSA